MPKNTIKLKKYLDIINEYEAESEIYPGELNCAGLVLIGLYELEGDLIDKIIEEER